MKNAIDISAHDYMVMSDNKVLGHFSNREFAIFTAAQRKLPGKTMAVNGVRMDKDDLERALRQYGDLREIEEKQEGEWL